MNFQQILFPTDFSPRSKAAEPHVEQLVRLTGAHLIILNVLNVPGLFPSWPSADYLSEATMQDLLDQSRTTLKSVLPEIAAERKAEFGDPASVICASAEVIGADLIMMPTHGCGLFRRTLLGSVTSKVLHDAHCAVWTDTHTESSVDNSAKNAPERIVCATDNTEETVELLRQTADLARLFDAKVWLAHAIPRPLETSGWEGTLTTEMRNVEAFYTDVARAGIAKAQAKAGTSFEVRFGHEDVAQVIASAAHERDCQLVITGRGASGKLFGGLRSHVFSIIQQSPCPVLSLCAPKSQKDRTS
jgi:nucleotide-binding universal stress UspA family protein